MERKVYLTHCVGLIVNGSLPLVTSGTGATPDKNKGKGSREFSHHRSGQGGDMSFQNHFLSPDKVPPLPQVSETNIGQDCHRPLLLRLESSFT